MLRSLAPARRRLVIVVGLLAVALAAGVVAVVASRPSTSAATAGPVAQDSPGPVLLVPGYGGSTTSLQPLAAILRATGRDVRIVELPDNAQGDLDTQAAALAHAADDALRNSDATSLDVVGYSAGGVVARLWVRDHGGAAVARRVVTLGSPQHGTQVAALGALFSGACPVACQQLAPDSPLLAALNSGDETPDGPQWLSLWTTQDNVVLPPDSASIAGARNVTVQSLCPTDAVDHSGLPGDPVVQRAIVAALGVTFAAAAPGCDGVG